MTCLSYYSVFETYSNKGIISLNIECPKIFVWSMKEKELFPSLTLLHKIFAVLFLFCHISNSFISSSCQNFLTVKLIWLIYNIPECFLFKQRILLSIEWIIPQTWNIWWIMWMSVNFASKLWQFLPSHKKYIVYLIGKICYLEYFCSLFVICCLYSF